MAIEAQQFTEKDELIAKFYTLRAGLSAIAEENEKISSVQSQIFSLKRKDENYQYDAREKLDELEDSWRVMTLDRDLSDAKHREQTLCDNINSLHHSLNEEKQMKENLYGKKARKMVKRKPPVGGIIGLSILSWFILLIVGTSIVDVMDYGNLPETTEMVLVFIPFFVATLPWIPFILTQKVKNSNLLKAKRTECQNRIQYLEERIEIAESAQFDIAEKIKAYEDELQDVANEKKRLIAASNEYPNRKEIGALYNKLNNEVIPTSTAKAKSIKNALNQQFSRI